MHLNMDVQVSVNKDLKDSEPAKDSWRLQQGA